ncbi:hypothetical protein SARC_00954 [Sphaeroforma arctica JP610]|uniref:RGS domain-containing protein n=1 Tax=Sphaeroforma arctica JP610 TaxID=667725 RepID=A0A0L0GDC5_9EUKA|nr:hypothetical protein SARC_00954 [Sphaeroforma arctica JP610]KNC86909.1 hypothetical protein SARC_00954 [Sphaeroforma arctica JP610]|eukprot:XP_014160811.1 hypothetical protein SARC_00954 [Sphaeroforma arctica JP610]
MALTITTEMFVYVCFCAIFIFAVPLFFSRRRYTLISERAPYLILWMQVPMFGLMTILCLLYNAWIPNSAAYGVTVFMLCLQTLFLCSVTTRIVNIAIKSIQQQHITSLLHDETSLLRIPSDKKNSDCNHTERVLDRSDSDASGTVRYLWWQSSLFTKLGRYQKNKHILIIYALICAPWFITLTTILAVNEPDAGDAALNESLFWYRVSICAAQISTVILVFPLIVVDVFFLTIEISIATLILLGDSVVLLGCRYAPPEPSQVLASNACSHYVYGCLFSVHVLSIVVPVLLTLIPVMRTQRELLLSNREQVEDVAGDNIDSSAVGLKSSAGMGGRTRPDTIDEDDDNTAYFPVDQPLPVTMVLGNIILTSMFYKHLSREYATENFLFLLTINRFRSSFMTEMCMSSSTTDKIASTQSTTASNKRRMSQGTTLVSEMVEQVFVDTSVAEGSIKHKSSKDKIKNNFTNGSAGVQGPPLLKVTESKCLGDTHSDISTSDMEQVANVQCDREITKVANRMYHRFIRSSAEFQVNLSYGCVVNIERLLAADDCFATMFDEAARSVTNLLENDSMARFKKLHGKAIYRALRANGSMGGASV